MRQPYVMPGDLFVLDARTVRCGWIDQQFAKERSW